MIARPTIPGIPSPKGPYCPAIVVDGFVFVSGQGPFDPEVREFVLGSIEEQTRLVMDNVERILAGCGAGWSDVVKCSVFLRDEEDFAAMNEVYASYFPEQKPTRTTIACRMVLPGMKVEIDCIARVSR